MIPVVLGRPTAGSALGPIEHHGPLLEPILLPAVGEGRMNPALLAQVRHRHLVHQVPPQNRYLPLSCEVSPPLPVAHVVFLRLGLHYPARRKPPFPSEAAQGEAR